jgi:hypothetical protein
MDFGGMANQRILQQEGRPGGIKNKGETSGWNKK